MLEENKETKNRLDQFEAFAKDIWKIVILLLIKAGVSPEDLVKCLDSEGDKIVEYSQRIFKAIDKQKEESKPSENKEKINKEENTPLGKRLERGGIKVGKKEGFAIHFGAGDRHSKHQNK